MENESEYDFLIDYIDRLLSLVAREIVIEQKVALDKIESEVQSRPEFLVRLRHDLYKEIDHVTRQFLGVSTDGERAARLSANH